MKITIELTQEEIADNTKRFENLLVILADMSVHLAGIQYNTDQIAKVAGDPRLGSLG